MLILLLLIIKNNINKVQTQTYNHQIVCGVAI